MLKGKCFIHTDVAHATYLFFLVYVELFGSSFNWMCFIEESFSWMRFIVVKNRIVALLKLSVISK